MDKTVEIIKLSEQILGNIELQEIPLSSIALRCARLARMTGNNTAVEWFKYELSGYPTDKTGAYVLPGAFEIARLGNRAFFQKIKKDEKPQEYMFPHTVSQLEAGLEAAKDQMKAAQDPNISISSANPHQHVSAGVGNLHERSTLRETIVDLAKKIDQIKSAYYNYILGVYYEIKLKNLSEDIFQKRKLIVDKALSKYLPETLQKFILVYDRLRSESSEDWSSALTSCRRAIKDIADLLYPASDETITTQDGIQIKLDDEHYVVRLKQFIKKSQNSESFEALVGSNLEFIADRLDAIYRGASKATHENVNQEDAERYVLYSYMLLGDILSLYKSGETRISVDKTKDLNLVKAVS